MGESGSGTYLEGQHFPDKEALGLKASRLEQFALEPFARRTVSQGVFLQPHLERPARAKRLAHSGHSSHVTPARASASSARSAPPPMITLTLVIGTRKNTPGA